MSIKAATGIGRSREYCCRVIHQHLAAAVELGAAAIPPPPRPDGKWKYEGDAYLMIEHKNAIFEPGMLRLRRNEAQSLNLTGRN